MRIASVVSNGLQKGEGSKFHGGYFFCLLEKQTIITISNQSIDMKIDNSPHYDYVTSDVFMYGKPSLKDCL